MDRKPYASRPTDGRWAILEPLVPPERPNGRHRTADVRKVFNTIPYLVRTGCRWDRLPHDLLPGSTVYRYFARWRDDGTRQSMMDQLREQTRRRVERVATPRPAASTAGR